MIFTSVIGLGLGILSAVLILAGGIVLFVVGRGRGALPGAGFVVLAVGLATGSLISTFAPEIVSSWGLSVQAFSAMYSTVQLLFDLLGLGLIIAAIVVLARSGSAPATAGPAPGPQPGQPYGQPGQPYGQAPPEYGQAPPGYGQYPGPPHYGHGGPPPGAQGSPPSPGH